LQHFFVLRVACIGTILPKLK